MSLPSRLYGGIGAAGAALACALALATFGCSRASSHDFVSDNPFGNGSVNGGDASGSSSSGGTGGGASGGDDPGRAIAEADIIQIDGTRLYALSQYGGLSIIDIGTKDKLTLLGRYRTSAMPFEMYLRGDTVYAMFTGWGQYVCDGTGQSCSWEQSSHVEALDVHDAAHVVKLGSFDVPGAIADSRIVGDVLYAVSYEDGYCWNCQSTPNTTVTSLAVADPAHIGVVDQLTFTTPDPDNYGWWRRSITVNQDRMYVGGVDWDGTGEGHSTIQIVDISDPAGHLAKGASVQAKGQIESRWQMDEHAGVLRVISQPGTWNTAEAPTLQTFQVKSATEITPLAELPLTLPQPERLRSVRFDADRAYAITAVQMDPLFTFDLTDPANPAQVGQLEMPGWVYFLEPRGDRVFALGYEQNNPDGSLAVSLFDVADIAHPTMVQRVHFGGEWSNLPEDQDRIHKAFNVDDDHGAIFVPYSAWSYDKPNDYYGCGRYESGIQIIDFTHDSLTARGAAAAKGEARRAFVHEDRLFGVSDAQVTTFDIADRDHPAQKAAMALSTDVSQAVVAGNKVVRLSNDWWTGAARLEIAPLSDPGRATPLGTLDLTALGDDPGSWCWGWTYWGARVFTRGNFVYLVRTSGYYDYYGDGYGGPGGGPKADVAVIDISDVTTPTVRGRLSFSLPLGYRWYGGLIAGGDDLVLAGHTLVFRSIVLPDGYSWDASTIEQASLEVVDVTDPDHLLRTTVALADGYGHTPLVSAGSDVYTSHWSPLPGDGGKVRFYVDHLATASLGAPTLTSTNVPGSLLSFDRPSGRVVTVDYERVVDEGVSYQDCYTRFGYNAQFQSSDPYVWDTNVGTCTGLHRTLELLEMGEEGATVIGEMELDDRLAIYQTMLGDDRIFAPNGYGYSYYDDVGGASSNGQQVLIIGGMREGALQLATAQFGVNDYFYAEAVSGKKLVMSGYSPPGLTVVDATNLDHVTSKRVADLDGYTYAVTMAGDTALCSMGPWGLQSVDITP